MNSQDIPVFPQKVLLSNTYMDTEIRTMELSVKMVSLLQEKTAIEGCRASYFGSIHHHPSSRKRAPIWRRVQRPILLWQRCRLQRHRREWNSGQHKSLAVTFQDSGLSLQTIPANRRYWQRI